MSLNIKALTKLTAGLYQRRLEGILGICESEIEKLFLWHFIHFWEQAGICLYKGIIYEYTDPDLDTELKHRLKGPIHKPYCIKFKGDGTDLTMTPQFKINVGGKQYRIDFLIEVKGENKPATKICIECDGYDYHYKNIKKVNSDNERTHNLLKHGYHVLRYTGSQIKSWKTYEDFQEVFNTILLLDLEPSEREEYFR